MVVFTRWSTVCPTEMDGWLTSFVYRRGPNPSKVRAQRDVQLGIKSGSSGPKPTEQLSNPPLLPIQGVIGKILDPIAQT